MQRFYKSQEHRNYTKALNKIIPTKIEALSSWLTTSRPVIVNYAFPRGIDYASISMLQLGTTSFWLLDYVSFHGIYLIPLIMMMSFGYFIRLIYYLLFTMTRNHPQIELPPRIVTSNSKVALVLDRDYENSEEPRKRPALTKTGSESDQGDKLNISSLFESYRSKALAHAQNSGLLVTKNYHEILSLSHILLLQMDNYSEMQIKNIRYIEIALDDDDGGLCKLRKTIINSFSKTFDSTAEDEFFQRMQFLFQHLAYTILLRSLKKKISERTLVANLISPILHTFFHNAYIHLTIWPNTFRISSITVGNIYEGFTE
ncbi:unnamed protein product [Rhizophagus irregularis]|nr:unnamed protein product [Rhizophagus irregularis]